LTEHNIIKVFGKHAGKVLDNNDTTFSGKVKVEVPTVLGTVKRWAWPSVPYAAKELGLFFIPPKKANVWVEFAGGDIEQPIWSGCFWNKGQVPSRDTGEMILATPSGKLKFNSKTPKADILLELQGGTSITIKDKSITIETGGTDKIELSSSSTKINGSALEVT